MAGRRATLPLQAIPPEDEALDVPHRLGSPSGRTGHGRTSEGTTLQPRDEHEDHSTLRWSDALRGNGAHVRRRGWRSYDRSWISTARIQAVDGHPHRKVRCLANRPAHGEHRRLRGTQTRLHEPARVRTCSTRPRLLATTTSTMLPRPTGSSRTAAFPPTSSRP